MLKWKAGLSAGAVAVALSGCMSMPFMGGRYVMEDEIRTLFAGKTVYARNVRTNTQSVSYYTEDGQVRQLRNGRKRTGIWYVDPGAACACKWTMRPRPAVERLPWATTVW